MKVLIVRHAPAGDREKFAKTGRPDGERPLTAKGRRKMELAARGLTRVVDGLELVVSSPLRRARQTAAVLLKAFPKAETSEIQELSLDAEPEALLGWLARRREEFIALVGHEPHLSGLIAILCVGRSQPFTELRKGQACLLEFDSAPRRGAARLLWSLEPGQLRRLA